MERAELRARARGSATCKTREVALHLAVDIVVFTAVVYFTGGPTNPFVSLYLVPISLAATSLPTRYAWLTVAMCGAGYSLLWWRSVPLPPVHARFGSEFDLHLAGMWINFVIAAVLIVLFVGRMAWLVRQRDRELAAMRENALRDQQLIELGTLAAGTAHEINTPLSTLRFSRASSKRRRRTWIRSSSCARCSTRSASSTSG